MNLEEYLLTCVGEEGCEISQQCSKTNRFGADDVNILEPTGPDNVQRIINEFNDLLECMNLLADYGTIPRNFIRNDLQRAKRKKVFKYARYAALRGRLALTPADQEFITDGGETPEPVKRPLNG